MCGDSSDRAGVITVAVMGWVGSVRSHASSKIRHYFHNSSIQGLRYITEPGRNITERIFWIVVCFSSMLGTYKLLMASWYNFQNNAVSFVVETSHLDWNTSFASISICESDSPDKIFETGNKLFGNERNMNMDFYLRDIAFFDGTCYSCKTHCNVTMNCTSDLQHLISHARATCDKFLRQCSWNGETFDCCSHFLPLDTETGLCFTLNSIHTKTNGKKMKFISNRHTGPGRLDLMVFEAAKLFIHSPEDVPSINHPQEEKAVLNWGTLFTLQYQVNEISNDPLLKGVSVHQRNCRFPEENTLSVYNYYSYSACVVDCRAKAQVRFCNCTHHFMPKMGSFRAKLFKTQVDEEGVPTCTIEGLICLTDHSEILRALKVKDSEKKGLVCDCMSSCQEPEYTVLIKQQEPNEDYPLDMSDYGSMVSVIMDSLPSQRFRRNVVRTRLDLVVSMGGTAGLFLGASILSIAELLVFMLLRGESRSSQPSPETRIKKDILKQNITNSLHLVSPTIVGAGSFSMMSPKFS